MIRPHHRNRIRTAVRCIRPALPSGSSSSITDRLSTASAAASSPPTVCRRAAPNLQASQAPSRSFRRRHFWKTRCDDRPPLPMTPESRTRSRVSACRHKAPENGRCTGLQSPADSSSCKDASPVSAHKPHNLASSALHLSAALHAECATSDARTSICPHFSQYPQRLPFPQ